MVRWSMNALACAIRTTRISMGGLGKAARNAAISGRREMIKPLRSIRSTGPDIEGWKITRSKSRARKLSLSGPFLDTLP